MVLRVIFSYVNKYNFRVIRLTWRRDQRWSLTDRRREEWRRWDVWRRWSWGKERRRHLGRFSLRAGMFRDHLQGLKSHYSVPRYMLPACQFYRGDCHVCNLDVIPLQIVATSSFHPANGGCLSANHIYGSGHLPATNTNIHIQLHEGVHTFLCFSTLYSRCIHNTHTPQWG